MSAPRAPTLGTIAALAGVSRMTVSLALRRNSRISLTVRQKIQALARRVGYQPDPEVSRFMTYLRSAKPHQRGAVIGFLHCLGEKSPWRHDLRFAKFYASAAKRCEELGYRLEEYWVSEPGMTPRRLGGILRTRGIEGVLLTPLLQGGGYAALDFSNLSVVAIGYSVLKPKVNRVSANHFHATSLALSKIQEHGYKKPGLYVRDDVDTIYGHQIVAAFRYHEFRFAKGHRLWPSLVSRTMNELEFISWVETSQPDVVLGPGAEPLRWLHRAGWAVPGRIGYVDLSWMESDPDCAGIALNYEGVAASAVDLLVTHINHRQKGIPASPFSVQIEGSWVEGRTIRELYRRASAREKRNKSNCATGPVLDGFSGAVMGAE